jgi:PA14 domain/Periplasmic copper-binding protein (NosD)/Right handed beta helix region
MYTLLMALALVQGGARELPLLEVTEDDTRIEESVRVVIPAGLVIADENGNGVLQIVADDVRVVFEPGSVLRGAAIGVTPDQFSGLGVRVEGHGGVRLEGLRVRGYKVGIHATGADQLSIEGADVSDNFAQRLRSTPDRCDDGADWLACHDNDENEWLVRYGAGIYIEDSSEVGVSDCRARRTQNGLLLDRVMSSRVSRCDFSFLSGWGLGLWRSSKNVVEFNAFDFCIRGYSHGVYNRGQDSAGILVFEQCSRNYFLHNSATHGGDGVFGFAGSEALGQHEDLPEGFDATRLGNNDNTFFGNDFSYAAAHGLEMTFSFGNSVVGNRFTGNAICGIWGGYSQGMRINTNTFVENGDAGYGLERGGVNIEHSKDNWIWSNDFVRNACGVHLWWDADEGLLATPWVVKNGAGCEGNAVFDNHFDGDTVGLHLRACEPVIAAGNEMLEVTVEVDAEEGAVIDGPRPNAVVLVGSPVPDSSPVGARAHLAGRENIIMGEWGPWDHESPFVQFIEKRAGEHHFALHEIGPEVEISVEGEGLQLALHDGTPREVVLSCEGMGFFPYTLHVGDSVKRGVIERLRWEVACFATTADPREDEAAWHAAAARVVPELRDSLDLAYAMGGPADLNFDLPAEVGRDHFGTLATTTLPLAAGRYELTTMSDDGVRVYVDGERVIDNWTWHAPAEDRAVFEVAEQREVRLRVEHFELDGYATLQLSLARTE